MSVTSSKVYESSLGNDIDPLTVLQLVFHDIVSSLLSFNCHLLESSHIHLTIEMTCITADCAILHIKEMFLDDNAVTSCNSHEYISDFSRLLHLHHLETIHNSLHSLDRIDFCHNHLSAKTLSSHCNTLSAPSITGYNDILAGYNKICCAVDSIPYRLTCTVSVIKKMLAVCIVNEHHREAEFLRLVELNEAQDSCCGLFTSSNHVRDKVSVLGMHKIYEITAIIDDDVRTNLEHPTDVFLVLLWSRVIPRKNIQASLNEGSCYIILSREGVTSCYIHLRTTCCENLTEICRLCLKMYRESHLQPFERQILPEFLFKSIKKRHMMSYPFDFQPAVMPELRISDFTCHYIYQLSLSVANIVIFSIFV